MDGCCLLVKLQLHIKTEINSDTNFLKNIWKFFFSVFTCTSLFIELYTVDLKSLLACTTGCTPDAEDFTEITGAIHFFTCTYGTVHFFTCTSTG